MIDDDDVVVVSKLDFGTLMHMVRCFYCIANVLLMCCYRGPSDFGTLMHRVGVPRSLTNIYIYKY